MGQGKEGSMNATSELEVKGARAVRDRLTSELDQPNSLDRANELNSPLELDQSNSLDGSDQFFEQFKYSVASNWNQAKALTRILSRLLGLSSNQVQTNLCVMGPASEASAGWTHHRLRPKGATVHLVLVLRLRTSGFTSSKSTTSTTSAGHRPLERRMAGRSSEAVAYKAWQQLGSKHGSSWVVNPPKAWQQLGSKRTKSMAAVG
jgi:hypothetical protein